MASDDKRDEAGNDLQRRPAEPDDPERRQAEFAQGMEIIGTATDGMLANLGKMNEMVRENDSGPVRGDPPDANLVNISNQFTGLPMESLIGGPLKAACSAQVMLANATTEFINRVGFDIVGTEGEKNKKAVARLVSFSFTRNAPETAKEDGQERKAGTETVEISVPVLSIVKIPTLFIDKVDITFDMEVKSSSSSSKSTDMEASLAAHAKVGVGCFSLDVDIKGSVASHEANTRSSDNSAKYHVAVSASQGEPPEGLSRVLDILSTAIVPKVTPNAAS